MKRFALLILSAFISHSALATDWGLGGAIGQPFPTGPSDFFHAEKEELHGSLWVRHMVKPNWGYEVNYQRLNFENRQTYGTDANVTGYSLNGVMKCTCYHSWHPIGALGLGLGEITDLGSKKYQELLAFLRLGVEYNLTQNFALGAHTQFSYLPETSSHAPTEIHALSYLVSAAYSFGGSEAKAAERAHAKTETHAPEVAVHAVADADGDGIPDTADKCPSTPAGAKVNAYGCQEKEKAEVRLNLVFPAGKSVITPDQKGQVEEVAQFMKQNPTTKVTIEGHTDNTGSEALNKKLSKSRAEAVRQSLIKDFGVAADRVKSEGFGSSKPVDSNDSVEGRQKNRRVIATIE
jgi:OOP family OmpA-OmpF porin